MAESDGNETTSNPNIHIHIPTPVPVPVPEVGDSLVSRLIYLAIHEHQHQPARQEALARLQRNANKRNVDNKGRKYRLQRDAIDTDLSGNFDFECAKDTKYLINAIPNGRGFGINYRLFSVEPIELGLVTNRVALLMDSINVGPFANGRICNVSFFY